MHYRGPVGNAQDNAKRYSRPAKTGKDAWKSFAASLVNSSHPCWFISLWRDKKKDGVDAIGKFQFQGHFQGNQGDNRSILWGVVDFFGSSDFAPTGPVDPKFQVEWVTPTNHSSSRITRLNALSYGIKILTDLFFLFVTMQTDRRTDRQTDRRATFS